MLEDTTISFLASLSCVLCLCSVLLLACECASPVPGGGPQTPVLMPPFPVEVSVLLSLTAACELLTSPLGLEFPVALSRIFGVVSNLAALVVHCKVGIYLPQGCCKDQTRKHINKALPTAVDLSLLLLLCYTSIAEPHDHHDRQSP